MRVSRATKELAEKNRETMLKAVIFDLWVHRHLRNHERIRDYEKAYNFIHSEEEKEAESDEQTLI
jgi:hypothetical protein